MTIKILNRQSLLLLAVSAMLLTACSKILDKQPIGEKVLSDDESASISAADAEASLTGAYGDVLANGVDWGANGFSYWFFDRTTNGDARADNSYAGSDNPANHEIDLFKISPLNGNVTRDWGFLYGFIGKLNELIYKVAKCTDPALSAARKNQILAEARTMRAACFFDVVRLWGDAPLLLQPIDTRTTETIFKSVMLPKVSKDIIYDSILADLNFSLPNLRTVSNVPNRMIVTKGVANTLLAKIYATLEPHDWNKVKQYCSAVIGDGGYTMLQDYDYLFDTQHQNSTEAIWEVQQNDDWSAPLGGNWLMGMYIGSNWPKFNIPSHDLIRAFNEEGDVVRFKSSITFTASIPWVDPFWKTGPFPFINKCRGEGGVNFIIYRLPDILLLKAEALNELGDVPGAAVLVNQVRTRAKLHATTANNQADMRLAIEKERQLELAFEGHRWFDLVRTGRVMDVMKKVKDENGQLLNYPIKPNKLLFPIPQTQLDQNSRLTQNSGY